MIVRTWRARIGPGRIAEYERFAETVSRPMFQSLGGCEAVFFGRDGEEALVVTVWSTSDAVEALAEAPAYTETARRIEDEGLVAPGSVVEIFELHGLWAGDLASGRRASPRNPRSRMRDA